jgi:uncharacterized UBP type Zn finger protein
MLIQDVENQTFSVQGGRRNIRCNLMSRAYVTAVDPSKTLWIDFNCLQDTSMRQKKTLGNPDEGVEALLSLGFTRDQAVRALKNTQGNVDRAANWLLQ